ncbi:MAG: hypothetical protein ABI811_00455 [Acidobacteriota bacterium]
MTTLTQCLKWVNLHFMPDCEHSKTEFLMRRDGVDYMRCLGCDQVFEAGDLEEEDAAEDESPQQPQAS